MFVLFYNTYVDVTVFWMFLNIMICKIRLTVESTAYFASGKVCLHVYVCTWAERSREGERGEEEGDREEGDRERGRKRAVFKTVVWP